MSVRILVGDMRQRLRELPDASVDSVVCDPPYHLIAGGFNLRTMTKNGDGTDRTKQANYRKGGFMGQQWDGGDVAFDPETWAEVLRVLKPGGHLVAFSGTRTYHRMAVAIEDAGFEIRDQLAWVYGSGFPKSLDVSKAIDKARDDSVAVRAVCAWVEQARRAADVTHAQIDEVVGLNSGGATAMHWTADEKRKIARVATWEQWLRLKTFLAFGDEMDAEVWRLNGRKGQPGEAWEQREVIGQGQSGKTAIWSEQGGMGEFDITAPATEAAQQWQGWGTALKPSWEPICLARKPLIGSVAQNVLTHGTGALNIDATRIGGEPSPSAAMREAVRSGKAKAPGRPGEYKTTLEDRTTPERFMEERAGEQLGRWPANLCHDGSDEVLAGFPDVDGGVSTGRRGKPQANVYGDRGAQEQVPSYNDSGSAARFFYCAKATTEERGEGNNHPTVKPVALMRWLCRLVTPKGGTVLDPFMGSGSTALACDAEQFDFIGCELSPEYAAIAERRVRDAAGLFAEVKAA